MQGITGELLLPSLDNLVDLLRKCRLEKDLRQAKRLYGYMRQHQLHSHPALGNCLVPVLVECGDLPSAHHLFHSLPVRDVYSWTSVISGFAHGANPCHALSLYRKMPQDSINPNHYTFVALLKACAVLDDPNVDRLIHADIVNAGLERDAFIGNTLVDMYGKHGSPAEARHVFDRLPVRSAVSWNALIAGYADYGLGEEALGCFEQMQLDGFTPNDITYTCSLKACGSIGAAARGQLLCAEVTKKALDRDVLIGSTIVDMYAKCDSLAEAQHVFASLPTRDAVSWNALTSAYAANGLDDKALSCFEQMQLEGVSPADFTFLYSLKACGNSRALETSQDIHSEITRRGLEIDLFIGSAVVDVYGKCGLLADAQKVFDHLAHPGIFSWNALISGYSEHGHGEEALSCYEKMQIKGVPPDDVTFPCSLKACGIIGALETGQAMHGEVTKRGLERSVSVANTLIDMYGKCGSLAEGWKVFKKLPAKDAISWTAMIKAYGENHNGNMAIEIFEDMLEQGIKPTDVTFTCLLAACSHTSLISKGQEYFKLMTDKLEMKPTEDHYSCMVDLFARSGHVFEAKGFAEAMQCLPSKDSIVAMLSACKIHGDVDLGLRCFQHLVLMNQENASAYALLADIYATAGMLSDAKSLEEMRKHAGAKKMPANASIEVKRQAYEFVVGNIPGKEISSLLDMLGSQIKDGGFVPNLDLVLTNMSSKEKEAKASEFVDIDSSFLITQDIDVVYDKAVPVCHDYL